MPEATTISSVEAVGQMYNQTNEFVCLGEHQPQHQSVHRPSRQAHTQCMMQLPEVHPRTVQPTERPLELKIWMLRAEVLKTIMYGCVTWSPCACYCDTLAATSPPQLSDSLYRSTREQPHRPLPISYYLDTLMKTGSESVDAMMRRRRILFAGFVARMADTRLPNCVMFGSVIGERAVWGGQEK